MLSSLSWQERNLREIICNCWYSASFSINANTNSYVNANTDSHHINPNANSHINANTEYHINANTNSHQNAITESHINANTESHHINANTSSHINAQHTYNRQRMIEIPGHQSSASLWILPAIEGIKLGGHAVQVVVRVPAKREIFNILMRIDDGHDGDDDAPIYI